MATCKTCGDAGEEGTGLCNGCWEVQRRLPSYLRDGGEKAILIVEEELALARARLKLLGPPVT